MPGTSFVGTWAEGLPLVSMAPIRRYSRTVGSSFTFNANVAPDVTYAVYAWWNAQPPTGIRPYPTTSADEGTLLGTATVNQRNQRRPVEPPGHLYRSVVSPASRSTSPVAHGPSLMPSGLCRPLPRHPRVIVDNADPGRLRWEAWSKGHVCPGFYGPNATYSARSGVASPSTPTWCRERPTPSTAGGASPGSLYGGTL